MNLFQLLSKIFLAIDSAIPHCLFPPLLAPITPPPPLRHHRRVKFPDIHLYPRVDTTEHNVGTSAEARPRSSRRDLSNRTATS